MNFPIRPRRNRRTPAIRNLVRETSLSPNDFILPLFLHEDAEDTPIASMPGVTRWSLEGLVQEVGEAHALGINAVVLFPKIEESLKTPCAEECYNDDGLVPRAIQVLKEAYPSLCVITDVALDPYNSDGHDGVVARDGLGEPHILNDETVGILVEQALCHARAGADIKCKMDLAETKDGLELTVELPGLEEKDVNVSVADGMLTMTPHGEDHLLLGVRQEAVLVVRDPGLAAVVGVEQHQGPHQR